MGLPAAFVLLTLAGGVGIVAYALMWVFLPLDPDRSAAPGGPGGRPGWDLTGVLGILALGLGVLLGTGRPRPAHPGLPVGARS